ncbi:hypothetical protein V6N13_051648 [Hibiscus sabdariffa]
MNVADSESRPVLGPAGNKAAGSLSSRKPVSKPLRKVEKSPVEVTVAEEKKALPSYTVSSLSPKTHSASVSSMLRRHEQLLHSNLSLNASCSSDASTDSFQSRASTGRLIRSYSVGSRRKPYASKPRSVVSDGGSDSPPDSSHQKKRCTWVTPNTAPDQNRAIGATVHEKFDRSYIMTFTGGRYAIMLFAHLVLFLGSDPSYAAFHDEEWGVPVHDDKKLFELLVLSGALSELTWPTILRKRQIFREVFVEFDPVAVSKLNEKKIIASGSLASSLLSELKLRAIVENARQISKVINEFGSFDEYIWSFVNHKPIVSRFRYPRQVPVKTPKADVISKDLVRRGFRSVGPTVIYSFMQVAGITNDHLISCFRFQECITAAAAAAQGKEENGIEDIPKEKQTDNVIVSELSIAMDELSFSSE